MLTICLTDSLLFLFISMIVIAASLYLPEHISTMWRRAWFYYAGHDFDWKFSHHGQVQG